MHSNFPYSLIQQLSYHHHHHHRQHQKILFTKNDSKSEKLVKIIEDLELVVNLLTIFLSTLKVFAISMLVSLQLA